MADYLHFRQPSVIAKLVAAYPGKVNRWHKFLHICPECGDYFTSTRFDKKTCDSTCRSARQRRLGQVQQLQMADMPPWAE